MSRGLSASAEFLVHCTIYACFPGQCATVSVYWFIGMGVCTRYLKLTWTDLNQIFKVENLSAWECAGFLLAHSGNGYCCHQAMKMGNAIVYANKNG